MHVWGLGTKLGLPKNLSYWTMLFKVYRYCMYIVFLDPRYNIYDLSKVTSTPMAGNEIYSNSLTCVHRNGLHHNLHHPISFPELDFAT